MLRVETSARANDDILAAVRWLDSQRPNLGSRFLAEIDRAFRWIGRYPHVPAVVRVAPEVRKFLLRRFPWHAWYYIDRDTVRVFAVLHAGRNPGEWKHRLS